MVQWKVAWVSLSIENWVVFDLAANEWARDINAIQINLLVYFGVNLIQSERSERSTIKRILYLPKAQFLIVWSVSMRSYIWEQCWRCCLARGCSSGTSDSTTDAELSRVELCWKRIVVTDTVCGTQSHCLVFFWLEYDGIRWPHALQCIFRACEVFFGCPYQHHWWSSSEEDWSSHKNMFERIQLF